jgi:peptidyl-prolyl cis-trans isomerase C
VIRLNDVRKADIPTLEEARPGIENELRRGIANEAIESATADADVVVMPDTEIAPGAIRRIDLFE